MGHKKHKICAVRSFGVNKAAVLLIIAISASALLSLGCYPRPVGPIDMAGNQLTWSEMSFVQRRVHMQNKVLPSAAKLFGEWRPQRFKKADCTLCHGPGALNGDFNMPTSYLPPLSGELLLGPEFEKYPETTRLKLDRLVPMMSEALGVKSFSIITRKGFGCYSCHLGPNGAMFGN